MGKRCRKFKRGNNIGRLAGECEGEAICTAGERRAETGQSRRERPNGAAPYYSARPGESDRVWRVIDYGCGERQGKGVVSTGRVETRVPAGDWRANCFSA